MQERLAFIKLQPTQWVHWGPLRGGLAAQSALEQRYPKAQVRDFDGNPAKVTEMDAVVAYLQMLGTLVDRQKAQAHEQPR